MTDSRRFLLAERFIVFRILWFIMGLFIGAWIARPAKTTADTSTAHPSAKSDATPSANGIGTHTFKTTGVRAAPSGPDPLIEIDGIGPAVLEKLTALGITTFEELAQQNPDVLAEKMGLRISGDRIRRERWIEQARERARQHGSSLN